MAATFGWLCVETLLAFLKFFISDAATFGWLCVETIFAQRSAGTFSRSHLRVAVC